MPAENPPYFIGERQNGFFERHGVQWKEGTRAIQLELVMFREKMAGRMDRDVGGVSPAWHFKAIALALWPEDAPEGQPRFIWHRWADLMLLRACQHNYLAVAGSGGAGKSEFFALWLIINFLCDPANTICLATSITVSVSRKKLWGKITSFWTPLEKMGFPGKLVDSLHIIRYVDKDGVAIKGDMAGISLVVGERKKEREAVGRLIGIHQERIIFCADDLTELSEAITEAAFYNLSRGCTYFQFIGIGNPASYFDPFGKLAAPVKGWESITVEDLEWRTERGVCIHLDALKNPRITEGDERLHWMDSQETIDREISLRGSNSTSFWRMIRGFWSPAGVVELVYSEIEIIGAHAHEKTIWRDYLDQTRVSFLDPSFTNGGDRTCAYFGTLGINDKGVKCLQYDGYELFKDDVTSREETRSQQVIRWWRGLCEKKLVLPRCAGFDATGAGGPFGDLIDILWSKEVLKLSFAGSATDRPVSAYDPTPCNERYANLVTQIWYGAKESMRSGQIRGLCPEVIQELCSRKKVDEKGQFLLIRLQTKRDMLLHTNKSPDLADAAMGLHELCCQRLGLASGAVIRRLYPQEHTKPWKEVFKKYDAFADNKRRFAMPDLSL